MLWVLYKILTYIISFTAPSNPRGRVPYYYLCFIGKVRGVRKVSGSPKVSKPIDGGVRI